MIDFRKIKFWPAMALFLLFASAPLFSAVLETELALATILGEASPASPYAERIRLIHRLPSDLNTECN